MNDYLVEIKQHVPGSGVGRLARLLKSVENPNRALINSLPALDDRYLRTGEVIEITVRNLEDVPPADRPQISFTIGSLRDKS